MVPTNTQLILSEALPLLSREAEKAVFQQLAMAKWEMESLEALSNKKLHEHSQLWAAKQRVRKLKTFLVKSNLPLVVRVAKRFTCPGVNEEQLVSEGYMKLLQCINAFKVGLGFKFSTYLQRPLYRHFFRYIQKQAKRNAGRQDSETVFKTRVVEDGPHEVDELMEVLEANTAGLDAEEKTMLLHHYGIGPLEAKTLKGLSAQFGFSIGRIKRTLASATKKLGNVLIERTDNETE